MVVLLAPADLHQFVREKEKDTLNGGFYNRHFCLNNNMYYTYLLLTENDTLYCGYTNDLEKRFKMHLLGKGAKYTKSHKPVRIAYSAEFETKSDAMKEEARIKKLSREEKLKLIF